MSSYVDEKGKMDEKLNPKKKQETDWTQMLGLMGLGQGASAKTMLGFALGKLLRELWDRHLWERRQKQMTPTGEQVGDALGTDGGDAGGTKAAANGYVPAIRARWSEFLKAASAMRWQSRGILPFKTS